MQDLEFPAGAALPDFGDSLVTQTEVDDAAGGMRYVAPWAVGTLANAALNFIANSNPDISGREISEIVAP